MLAAQILCGAPDVRQVPVKPGEVPDPESLASQVAADGRTSTLLGLDIAAVGKTIPRTFSRNLVGNTEGFDWHVSRHFALKTDLPPSQVRETLTLLELGLPHLEAIFGQSIAALADRRMAFVFASSRNALMQAMVSDDMHVLRLGGITQEGYWGAYQYAGTPYQNRYIILHELVHLYQYCLVGNTRHFYGFFIEGAADFFSSHVYDPERGRLTVNVLDRAPMHNHLAAGLAEWQARGKPSLSSLYNGGTTTRGLDVLMTAFFQSTPEREQSWRIYCDQTMRKASPDDDPKPLSDRLVAALYGDWQPLDLAFARWMERQPSFVTREYGFDQAGETLVSEKPAAGKSATLQLNPAPLLPSPADAFTRDYPRDPAPQWPAPANGFDIGFSILASPSRETGSVGLRLGNDKQPAVTVTVSNGAFIVIASPTLPTNTVLPLASAPAASHEALLNIRLSASPDGLLLAAFHGAPPNRVLQSRIPLASDLLKTIGHAPVTLFATAGGLRIVPQIWNSTDSRPGASPPQPVPGGRVNSSRFNARYATGPIYRAAWLLGENAPAPLLIVRNMLLADPAGGPRPRLPDSELEAESFWQGIGTAIQDCPADAATRNAALCELADIALDIALLTRNASRGDAALARLRTPLAGQAQGRLSWSLDGRLRHAQPIRKVEPGGTAQAWMPDPGVLAKGPHALTVKAELTWLGMPLTIERTRLVNPGIPSWHVLGPFMLPDARYANVPFPPETEPLDLRRIFTATDGTQMVWTRVAAPPDALLEADHLVHFAKGFRRQANFAAAYAAATFESPRETPAILALGATDGVQVWVNAACVLTDMQLREWVPGNVRIPITLRKGANTVLVKSLHGDGLWFLSGRLEDRDGRPLQGLVF
jgi:hypothetical protein